jgi:hypothetical protein
MAMVGDEYIIMRCIHENTAKLNVRVKLYTRSGLHPRTFAKVAGPEELNNILSSEVSKVAPLAPLLQGDWITAEVGAPTSLSKGSLTPRPDVVAVISPP